MNSKAPATSFENQFAKWCLNFFAFAAVLILAVLYAWSHRLMTDDAFITFQYSRNWVEGHGPVWIPGEAPVEGYSNFLWMVWMTLPFILGLDPVLFAQLSSLMFVIGSAFLLRRCAQALAFTEPVSNGLSMVFVLNFTLLRFATCGLETASNTFIWVLAFWALLRFAKCETLNARHLIFISLTFALLQWSRPDGILMVMPCGAFAMYLLAQKRQLNLGNVARLLLPFGLIMSVWLIWKVEFYGDILPNTFYAKAIHTVPWFGLKYLWLFFFSYLLIPVFAILIVHFRSIRAKINWVDGWLLTLCGGWMGYMVYLGGDYNEFRMMLPVWPFLLIAAFRWARMTGRTRVLWGVGLLMMVGSVFHGISFGKWYSAGHLFVFDTPIQQDQERFIGYEETGKGLRLLFGDAPGLRLGCKACGMIPYFSRYHFVDLHGLNDRDIAREGLRLGMKPGHQRWATFADLRNRGVHLVPIVTREEKRIRSMFTEDPLKSDLVTDLLGSSYDATRDSAAKLVFLPVHSGFLTAALYITPSPLVDSVIASRNLTIVRLSSR